MELEEYKPSPNPTLTTWMSQKETQAAEGSSEAKPCSPAPLTVRPHRLAVFLSGQRSCVQTLSAPPSVTSTVKL